MHLQVADEQTQTGSQTSAQEKKPLLYTRNSSQINDEDERILTEIEEENLNFDGPPASRANRNASYYVENGRRSLSVRDLSKGVS